MKITKYLVGIASIFTVATLCVLYSPRFAKADDKSHSPTSEITGKIITVITCAFYMFTTLTGASSQPGMMPQGIGKANRFGAGDVVDNPLRDFYNVVKYVSDSINAVKAQTKLLTCTMCSHNHPIGVSCVVRPSKNALHQHLGYAFPKSRTLCPSSSKFEPLLQRMEEQSNGHSKQHSQRYYITDYLQDFDQIRAFYTRIVSYCQEKNLNMFDTKTLSDTITQYYAFLLQQIASEEQDIEEVRKLLRTYFPPWKAEEVADYHGIALDLCNIVDEPWTERQLNAYWDRNGMFKETHSSWFSSRFEDPNLHLMNPGQQIIGPSKPTDLTLSELARELQKSSSTRKPEAAAHIDRLLNDPSLAKDKPKRKDQLQSVLSQAIANFKLISDRVADGIKFMIDAWQKKNESWYSNLYSNSAAKEEYEFTQYIRLPFMGLEKSYKVRKINPSATAKAQAKKVLDAIHKTRALLLAAALYQSTTKLEGDSFEQRQNLIARHRATEMVGIQGELAYLQGIALAIRRGLMPGIARNLMFLPTGQLESLAGLATKYSLPQLARLKTGLHTPLSFMTQCKNVLDNLNGYLGYQLNVWKKTIATSQMPTQTAELLKRELRTGSSGYHSRDPAKAYANMASAARKYDLQLFVRSQTLDLQKYVLTQAKKAYTEDIHYGTKLQQLVNEHKQVSESYLQKLEERCAYAGDLGKEIATAHRRAASAMKALQNDNAPQMSSALQDMDVTEQKSIGERLSSAIMVSSKSSSSPEDLQLSVPVRNTYLAKRAALTGHVQQSAQQIGLEVAMQTRKMVEGVKFSAIQQERQLNQLNVLLQTNMMKNIERHMMATARVNVQLAKAAKSAITSFDLMKAAVYQWPDKDIKGVRMTAEHAIEQIKDAITDFFLRQGIDTRTERGASNPTSSAPAADPTPSAPAADPTPASVDLLDLHTVTVVPPDNPTPSAVPIIPLAVPSQGNPTPSDVPVTKLAVSPQGNATPSDVPVTKLAVSPQGNATPPAVPVTTLAVAPQLPAPVCYSSQAVALMGQQATRATERQRRKMEQKQKMMDVLAAININLDVPLEQATEKEIKAACKRVQFLEELVDLGKNQVHTEDVCGALDYVVGRLHRAIRAMTNLVKEFVANQQRNQALANAQNAKKQLMTSTKDIFEKLVEDLKKHEAAVGSETKEDMLKAWSASRSVYEAFVLEVRATARQLDKENADLVKLDHFAQYFTTVEKEYSEGRKKRQQEAKGRHQQLLNTENSASTAASSDGATLMADDAKVQDRRLTIAAFVAACANGNGALAYDMLIDLQIQPQDAKSTVEQMRRMYVLQYDEIQKAINDAKIALKNHVRRIFGLNSPDPAVDQFQSQLNDMFKKFENPLARYLSYFLKTDLSDHTFTCIKVKKGIVECPAGPVGETLTVVDKVIVPDIDVQD